MAEYNYVAETTGKRLRRLRGKYTLAETAKEIGISTSALGAYERGERVPRDAVKRAIAEYYGRSVAYIFFSKTDHE